MIEECSCFIADLVIEDRNVFVCKCCGAKYWQFANGPDDYQFERIEE